MINDQSYEVVLISNSCSESLPHNGCSGTDAAVYSAHSENRRHGPAQWVSALHRNRVRIYQKCLTQPRWSPESNKVDKSVFFISLRSIHKNIIETFSQNTPDLLCTHVFSNNTDVWYHHLLLSFTDHSVFDQLQIDYYNLTLEVKQLQTDSDNLTLEMDQLQSSCDILTQETNKLQQEVDTLKRERAGEREYNWA